MKLFWFTDKTLMFQDMILFLKIGLGFWTMFVVTTFSFVAKDEANRQIGSGIKIQVISPRPSLELMPMPVDSRVSLLLLPERRSSLTERRFLPPPLGRRFLPPLVERRSLPSLPERRLLGPRRTWIA